MTSERCAAETFDLQALRTGNTMLTHLDPTSMLAVGLLVFSLAMVLMFEATNGFHDAANAVATVIYTKSLKPTAAVVWSGVMNFVGVLERYGDGQRMAALDAVRFIESQGSGITRLASAASTDSYLLVNPSLGS